MIIADAGSSSTKWIQTATNRVWHTAGYNPNYHKESVLEASLDLLISDSKFQLEDIVYYGAGCFREGGKSIVRRIILSKFPKAKLNIHSDLLGAARSVLGDRAGLIGILGTGSSLCHYVDGEVNPAPSMGFPLGDEASGYDLSRRVLRLYFRGILEYEFEEEVKDILERRGFSDFSESDFYDTPNWVLGSLWKDFGEFRSEEFLQGVIDEALRDLFNTQFRYFAKKKETRLSFVGSVAKSIEFELTEFFEAKGYDIERVVKDPLLGLRDYHIERSPN